VSGWAAGFEMRKLVARFKGMNHQRPSLPIAAARNLHCCFDFALVLADIFLDDAVN